MGDEYGYGPLKFAVINPNGAYSAPKQVATFDAITADEAEVTVWRSPSFQSWHGEVEIKDPDVIRQILGNSPVGSTHSICMVSHGDVWNYRHDRVWKYRRERKGNRANRKTRGYWETTERRSVIPNAVVTGVDQEFCAGAELPNTTVEFEVT